MADERLNVTMRARSKAPPTDPPQAGEPEMDLLVAEQPGVFERPWGQVVWSIIAAAGVAGAMAASFLLGQATVEHPRPQVYVVDPTATATSTEAP